MLIKIGWIVNLKSKKKVLTYLFLIIFSFFVDVIAIFFLLRTICEILKLNFGFIIVDLWQSY